ncbi:DUF3558 domain-containing protein [Saccharopolyspora sp. CA-218241]|uniref:DUF3558 domain-containing protein n=1 Tax=Saccharopolyspora sp. CA-218241 TaxID=3240027 RepID=UPI003D97B531
MTAFSLLATLGIAACSTSDGGSTTPPTQATSQAETSTIENPRDLKAVADACTLLTPDQLAALGGGGQPEASTSAYQEPQCYWRNDAFGVDVAINTVAGGLDVAFKEPGTERTEIASFPAAKSGETTTLCHIAVVVAEDQQLEIDYTRFGGDTPEMLDTCGMAEKLAAEAVKNLPA